MVTSALTLRLLNLLPTLISSPIKTPSTKTSCSIDLSTLEHHSVLHLFPKPPPLTAASAALSLPLLINPQDVLIVGGILEGRTFALVHPMVMGGLFMYTLWAGYLDWQWRRVRTIQEDVNELKKQVSIPALPAAVAAGADGGQGPPPAVSPSPVESKIKQLTEERKELVKGGYRDGHFNARSILLAFGVLV